jgi:hypothetical protein
MKRTGLAIALAIVASTLSIGATSTSAEGASVWRNCTAVNHKYPHGVGRRYAVDHVSSGTPVTDFKRSNRLFRIAMSHNKGLDRDHDKIACEKH